MTRPFLFARSRAALCCAASLLAADVVGGSLASAQTPPIVPPPPVLQQQTQQQSNITQEREARARWREAAERQNVRVSSQTALRCPANQDWQIDRIEVAGMSIIDPATARPFLEKAEGKRLGCNDISELTSRIYDLYDRAGLPLAYVYLADGAIKGNVLTISVQETKLEAYAICKNGKRQRGNSAFPLSPGKPFTLDALDQGVENGDQMTTFRPGPSHPPGDMLSREIDCEHPQGSTVTIKPGSKDGLGLVTVQTFQPLPFFASAGIDNLGGRSTGRSRLNASFGIEDVLGFYERFEVQGSHTTHFGNGHDRARNIAGDFTVPVGYWHFSLSGTYFDYRSSVAVNNQIFVTSGDQSLYAADVERVIGRSQTSVWSLGGGLTIKDTNNFINGIKLTTGSRRLTLLNARVSYRATRLLGGSFAGTLGLTQGITPFGALDDGRVTRAQPHAQYTQAFLSLNYGRSFGLGKDGGNGEPRVGTLRFQSLVSASYAPHALYGTEKVQIGGPFTVRGFDDTSLSGDVGGFTRNELIFYPNMQPFKIVGRISFFAGLDAGVIVRDYADKAAEKTLAGIAGGARLSEGRIRAEARVEKSIASPGFFPRSGTLFRFNVALLL